MDTFWRHTGTPLTPTKAKMNGEPGIDSQVISKHNAFALTIKINSLKHHSHEDSKVAARYSQVRSLLLQLVCVATL